MFDFLKRMAFRLALVLAVLGYLIRRKFLSIIKERYDPIALPALEDYVHPSEQDLAFRILGGEAIQPWLMIKIWEERMGRPKYFKSRLFTATIVHSTVKEDFFIASERRKSFFYEPYRRFIGHDSILFQEGARHRRERTILNRGFGQQTYRAALPAMIRAAERLVDRMETACKVEKSVECEPVLSKLTMEVVAEGAFSYDLNTDQTGMSSALRNMLRIGANPLCFLPG